MREERFPEVLRTLQILENAGHLDISLAFFTNSLELTLHGGFLGEYLVKDNNLINVEDDCCSCNLNARILLLNT